MRRRFSILLPTALLLTAMLISGCTAPQPAAMTPRTLIEEYVLAYNRGDADTIYAMLVVFDTPRSHPRYATREDVRRVIREKREEEGIRIADYQILENYRIENYAVISLSVTWERDGGGQVQENPDAGFIYLNGAWNMVDLILPPPF